MENLSNIGLDKDKSHELAEKLNELLANYSIFYQNTRGYHWHIKGKNFFELHVKFEELYNDLILKIDEIAERILTLGYEPSHLYSSYISKSAIVESNNTTDGEVAVREILEAFKVLLVLQRDIMTMAGEIEDEGTSALMSDYIREQEKLIWMYNAYIQ